MHFFQHHVDSVVPAASQASLLFVKLIIDHFIWTAENNTGFIVGGPRLIQKHGNFWEGLRKEFLLHRGFAIKVV